MSTLLSRLIEAANNFINYIKEAKEKNKAVHYAIYGGGFIVLFYLWRLTRPSRSYKLGKFNASLKSPTEPDFYDVAIIGAGPSGGTCGFYLAKAGRKVVVFDKKAFPRDKYCGDAITTMAQKHLKEMGALQQLQEEGKVHWSQSGGFVSPGGYSFIGDSAKEMNRGTEGVVVAIKRIHMDDKIAKACHRAGADLKENYEVEDAIFDNSTGVWNIKCIANDKDRVNYRARILIAADGAPSAFARKKGYVKTEPEGVCSRAYITGTHKFKFDGVIFYPPKLLPGYCAILRHADNELGFCTYIIPGGPAKNEDLYKLHEDILVKDPYVSAAISGPDLKIERMKSATLRLCPIAKSYGDNFLIIGDAAGFIDPLTGEGIQYAMESAKYACDVIVDALNTGDLSSSFLKQYQDKWYSDWGREFYWSMQMSLFLYDYPILLDAAASLIGKRGSRFLAEWANVMTGAGSKLWFLRPDVGPILFLEAVGIFLRRALGFKEKK